MRSLRIFVSLCLVLSLLVLAAPTFASKAGSDKPISDRILVKFKDDVNASTKKEVSLKHGGRIIGEIDKLNTLVIEVPAGKASEKKKAYEAEAAVEYAEPDFKVEAFGTPTDPYFVNQWALNNIGQKVNGITGRTDADIDALEAWDITTGTLEIKIAVLDTGVDQYHPDLSGRVVANNNFTTSPIDDFYGHGTHVAGIAAAAGNNGVGVAGVGYSCSIMNGKVLGDNGSGYVSWIANGIYWAVDPNGDGDTADGAKVINMSLGSSSSSKTLESAVNYAWSRGVVLVAAAGNSYSPAKQYPAAYTNCIAVAATDQYDNKAYFSNYGNKWVDVAAPGVNIYSTLPRLGSHLGAGYGYLDGTSMATPHVAGLAGLIFSTGVTSNSSVRTRIISNADRTTAGNIYSKYGIPRINAYNAVSIP